jgi:hypothetical protein
VQGDFSMISACMHGCSHSSRRPHAGLGALPQPPLAATQPPICLFGVFFDFVLAGVETGHRIHWNDQFNGLTSHTYVSPV